MLSLRIKMNVIAIHSDSNEQQKCVGPAVVGCQCRLAKSETNLVQRHCIAFVALDIYGDIMAWL